MERQVALPLPPPLITSEPRRGVILLVILSLLTLFMMLGGTYLVMAARARATAKAFATATNGSQSQINAGLSASLVDEAFLSVVRGSPSTGAVVTTTASNSLLGDKYGTTTTLSGSLVGSATGSLIVSFTSSVSGTLPAEQLNGLVLTFQTPTLTTASVRILRAEPIASSSNVKLYIPDGPTLSGVNLTSSAINSSLSGLTGPHFIINGREFTSGTSGPNESYDGYDYNNDFLADPFSPSSRPSFSLTGSTQLTGTTTWVSIGTSGTNLKIDNDGDGVPDSAWIDVGLPPFTDAAGTVVYPRAAILVTDLDGRLNVNAHGSRVTVDYGSLYSGTFATGTNALTTVTTSTSSFASKPFSTYPDGFGFGPSETAIDQTTLFSGSPGTVTAASSWRTLTEGITVSNTAANDPNSNRPPPNLGSVEGRYGDTPTGTTGLPGKPNVNDPINSSAQAWIATEGSAYFTSPGRYGSPPDVRGRMKVFVDDYGQPVYYKPYWSGTVSSITQDEVVDDPYEINLLRLSPQPGWPVNANARNGNTFSYANVTDNLFSAADLEAVLRIYDPDSRTLPQRLVALTGTQATGNRLLLSTDNWDSSAMTGTLRTNISTLISSATATVPLTGTSGTSAYEMFAPETLMGHKLDLNRPFHNTDVTEPYDATGIAERQKFAKNLYSLLYVIAGSGTALSGTSTAQRDTSAKTLAQWAVNIVDFRDKDSIVTGFEYDKNLINGWNVDGSLTTTSTSTEPDRAVVWGVERPEMFVTETVCWHDRQTDDDVIGSGKTQTNYQVVTSSTKTRDANFDQKRRPQGAFFFELYSPWDSQLAEYDGSGKLQAVRRTIQGGTSSLLRAEPMPVELASGAVATGTTASTGNALGRFDSGATLSLSGTVSDGSPVWRVVTIKSGTSLPQVTDPATSLSGSLWRSFYFTNPPASLVRTSTNGDIASGSNAVAFWPAMSATSTISIAPQIPKVFGTGSSVSGLTGTAAAAIVSFDTIFLSATTAGNATTTRAATLTEPLITLGTNASYDPYAVLHAQSATGAASFPLATVNDSPLDNLTYAASGITTTLTGTDGKKTLFQNGRHSNYFLLHLQRLANPTKPWDKDSNPYVTIDTQPIDLMVYNTGSTAVFPSVSPNYDEPTTDGSGSGFTYTFDSLLQRNYDDGESTSASGTSITLSLERGNTQVTGTTNRDIWSALINASGTSDATKLLSIQSSTRTAAAIDWSGKGDGVLTVSGTLPSKAKHSLGSLAPRFSSGTANPTLPSKPFPWMFWANRPFTSAAELAFVPNASSFDLLRVHATASGTGSEKLSTGWFGHLPRLFERTVLDTGTTALATPWDVISGRVATTGSSNGGSSPSLWDAVHVPSPFAGSYATLSLGTGTAATTSGSAALAPLGLDNRPYGQLPTFREAGRVNVNTITGSTTWLAVLGTGTQIPTSSGSFTIFNTPAKSFMDVLQKAVSTSGTTFVDSFTEANRSTDNNAYFRYQTVNRVANNVTIRSNVFAVWVTVGFFDSSGNEYGYDTGAIQRCRGFYIYDRSIPVGFSPGKDYNVRDGIMLRRIIP